MASNKKTVPFYGTEEQKEQLLKVIQELRDEKGCLMPIMQKAQEIYGYLPIEVQKIISDELNVPLEKIYGVATFYSWFNLNPKGKYINMPLDAAATLYSIIDTNVPIVCFY